MVVIPDTSQLLAKKYAIAWNNIFGCTLTEDAIVHINNAIVYLQQHPHIQFMFRLPSIEDSLNEEALQMLKKMYTLPEGYSQLCALLISHKRAFLLQSILSALVQLYWEKRNIEWFIVSSALPLSANQQEQCRTFLTAECGMEVRCVYAHDPNLIAGIRMQSNTFLWEHSVKKQMRMIHQLLVV